MTTINWRRVFVGGLAAAAGVGVVWLPVLLLCRSQYEAALQALGLSIDVVGRMATYGVIALLAIGFLAVWTYAAIRPRFGPGPRTAVLAAVAIWMITVVVDAGWGAFGVISLRLLIFSKAIDLLALIVGTLAGAKLYREETGSPETRSGDS